MDDELEAFKTNINLTEYAASLGYEMDQRESSRNSVIMRHSSGDKIVVARGLDRHWIYFSIRDDTDSGSIIDFIQNRTGDSFGQIRQKLRPWVGYGRPVKRPPVKCYARHVEPSSKDLARVLAAYNRTRAVTRHLYLEFRGLPASLLSDPRFDRRIFMDQRKNAVFPHWNASGICGFELKNKGFTGFSPGGEKGLWISRTGKNYTRLVIAESAIDALSHAAIFPDPAARYSSTGGKMNPQQPALIREAILKLPLEGEVIAATDADEDGRKMAEQIKGISLEAERAFIRHEPPIEGTDWNDQIRKDREQLTLSL
jgi:hypothetical protein